MGFSEYIKSRQPILFDGAMGTELVKRGFDLSCPGKISISNPEVIFKIHQEYSQSGAKILATNTFTLNSIYLKTHNQEIDIEAANRLGVEIAKKAAGKDCYVLGNMTSCGQLREPFGDYTEKDIYNNFKEQAEILASAGVDGFLIQTMYDLKEALWGLRACKDTASLPVLVSFTFSESPSGLHTMMGDTPEQCALRVAEAGGNAIGANCGELELSKYPELVFRYCETISIPILIQPNAGKPKIVGDKTRYDLPADVFAQAIKQCVEAGATLVGGCCGTGPEHIRKIAEMLKNTSD